MNINKLAVALSAAVLLASASIGAGAQGQAPIQVVSLYITNAVQGDFAAPGGIYTQFQNVSDKTITTVIFELHEKLRAPGGGPNGNEYQDTTLGRIRDVGKFSPGVVISRTHNNRFSQLNPVHRNVATLIPVEVTFADGTTWKAGM